MASRFSASVARRALAADFNHRPFGRKSGGLSCGPNATGYDIIVEMGGLSATVAHQKNAIMEAIGVSIGDIGVGALNPSGEIGGNEQIEDAIDAISSHAATGGL